MYFRKYCIRFVTLFNDSESIYGGESFMEEEVATRSKVTASTMWT
jgi:hypothetical protein